MKEFAIYTGLRALLLLATFGIVAGAWVLIAGSVPLFAVIVIAFVISGVASYFLLDRQRVAFASKVESRANAALEKARSKEDH
ncbi:DUF4229 domain-containing protein [Nocardioides sp.]|uniref:DUF4229 domain-containing protein n=1 Tax=Nocardioides sp. TaxID=35761 RepID=UPI0039E4BFD3